MTEFPGEPNAAKEPEVKSGHRIPIVNILPGMSPDVLRTIAKDANAMILIGHANGATQNELLPAINEVVESGVPVISLSDNPGAGHGVIRYSDQPQVDARTAGVTHLEKPNITNLDEVVKSIKESLDEGLAGKDLSAKLKDQFSYKPGEQKPVSELDAGVFPPRK